MSLAREPAGRPADFFERVWAAVEQIPAGRVSTYGHLARHLGVGRSARAVGWALKAAAGTAVPCHRVVNRAGALTGRLHFESPTVMEERLRSEGVAFRDDGCVDLSRHLWDPARPDLDAAQLSVGIGKFGT